MITGDYLALFLSAFTTFFVVIDPPGCVPIFASLTAGGQPDKVRAMAIRSTVIAGFILLVFALVGGPMLKALGISLDAFRIAGGLMLFMIAIEMVFEKRTERRESRAQEAKAREIEDISVFPMAMPMIAGPGSIASVMLLTQKAKGVAADLTVLAGLLAVLALTMISLLIANPLMRRVSTKIEAVITRLLGVLLAALATQFIIDGIRESFKLA